MFHGRRGGQLLIAGFFCGLILLIASLCGKKTWKSDIKHLSSGPRNKVQSKHSFEYSTPLILHFNIYVSFSSFVAKSKSMVLKKTLEFVNIRPYLCCWSTVRHQLIRWYSLFCLLTLLLGLTVLHRGLFCCFEILMNSVLLQVYSTFASGLQGAR